MRDQELVKASFWCFSGFLLKFKDPKIHFFTPVGVAVSD